MTNEKTRMSVIQRTLEPQLEALRLRVVALQQLAYGDPARAQSLFPLALKALRDSLDELQQHILPTPSERSAVSSAPRNGSRSSARPLSAPRAAEIVKESELEVARYRARVRSLISRLALAEELERRRLAVDLHDGLSQTIALAQIKLTALRLALGPDAAEPVLEIESLIEQANGSARSIGFELSPLILHDLGLAPALQWLVENIQARYGIKVEFHDDGLPKPANEQTRVILFRAIRELLINAAKHSSASRVLVRLALDGEQISVEVEDDGVGMQSDLTHVGGFGLFSIQERVSHVGGLMRIDSTPGRGTTIHLCTPLDDTTRTENCTSV